MWRKETLGDSLDNLKGNNNIIYQCENVQFWCILYLEHTKACHMQFVDKPKNNLTQKKQTN